MKKLFFVYLTSLTLIVAATSFAYAQDTRVSETTATVTPTVQATLTATPSLTPTTTQTVSSERRKLIAAEQARIKAARLKLIEEFKDRIENRREQVKTRIQTRREALKEKLSEFRDERKAQTTERVSDNLNKVNTNRVDSMIKQLEAMDMILEKASTKAAEAKSEGKDVSAIETAIDSAEAKVAAARTALEAQAAKDYTLVVTDESKVKDEAKAKRDALFADLKAVHEKVKEARVATAGVIRSAYITIGKEKVDDVTVTPTPTQTL